MKRHLILLVSILALLGASAFAQTKVPALINYQGNVRDAAGAAIGASSPVLRTVTFRFYNSPTLSTATERLWAESQSVTILSGNFSVLIGAGTPVTNQSNTGTFAEVFGKGPTVYLGITVDDGDPATTDPEISPRQQIVTTAFAFRATLAEGVDSAAIKDTMIAANAVTTTQINASAVTAAKIATGAVTNTQILDGTIATADIADSSITTAKILDGTIATADIADSSVTTAKIADGTIATADLADNSVTTLKIVNATVTGADIAPATITDANLGTNTATTVENLRIIRGSVNADGTIALGTGFTITGATPGFAAWQVNFNTPFSVTPTVLVSDYNSQDGFHAVVADPANANSFRCYYTMYNNNPTRRGFSFIAIGPR